MLHRSAFAFKTVQKSDLQQLLIGLILSAIPEDEASNYQESPLYGSNGWTKKSYLGSQSGSLGGSRVSESTGDLGEVGWLYDSCNPE